MAELNAERRALLTPMAQMIEGPAYRREIVEQTFETLIQAFAHLNAPIRTILAEKGLALSHVILLRILLNRGETTPSELAKTMRLTNGAITQLLKKLETEGFVKRVRRPEDRRLVDVYLTDKARQRFEKLHLATLNELTEAFDGWAGNDIEKLRHLLTRLSNGSQ